MKKNKNLILSTIAVFAVTVPAYWLATNALQAFAQGNIQKEQPRQNNDVEVVGTVVVTSKPGKVLNYAKKKGINPGFTDKTGKSKKIITLTELPSDPKVKNLKKDLNVKVEPDYKYKVFFTPDDSKYPNQWNLKKVKASKAWDITRGSSDVTVAVIDTGVLFSQTINGMTYSQPDFPSGRQWQNSGETGNTQAGDDCWTGSAESKKTNECDDDDNGKIDDWRGWDFMGGYRGSSDACPNHSDADTYEDSGDSTFVVQDNDPQPYSCDSVSSPSLLNKNDYSGNCVAWTSACYVGHGTMVASVIGAATDNNSLIAGIDHNAKLMSVRVADGYGYTTSSRIASGINYAADNGADVINMSLGMSCGNENFTDSVMETAIANAKSAGVVSVAASGNESYNTICYPASSPDVMAVGATDSNDKRLSYSNYSSKLDVVAPAGVPVANAPSAYINSNYYGSAGGTSLSTPHVAGLASLLKASDPTLTRNKIIKLIKNRADKVSGMKGKMFHKKYGYGRINLKIPLAVTEGDYPIYRLYRPKSVSHFFTKSVGERNKAVNRLGYRYEGIGFWALDTKSGTKPVYRLYRAKSVSHFFTKSKREKKRAVNRLGYKYEGIAFRVLTSGNSETKPVYRLYRAKSVSHFFTKSKKEKNRAVSSLGYKYEGVGFIAE